MSGNVTQSSKMVEGTSTMKPAPPVGPAYEDAAQVNKPIFENQRVTSRVLPTAL
jgi:hypothetical protein